MVEKENKMRELKRQMFNLQSKVKFLEEENDALNEKMDSALKERNKLRKDLHMTSLKVLPIKTDRLIDSSTIASLVTPQTMTRAHSNSKISSNGSSGSAVSNDPYDKSFRASYNNNYYDLNSTSSWDINYNTGSFGKLRPGNLSLRNVLQQQSTPLIKN
jgi:hypothetical protein